MFAFAAKNYGLLVVGRFLPLFDRFGPLAGFCIVGRARDFGRKTGLLVVGGFLPPFDRFGPLAGVLYC